MSTLKNSLSAAVMSLFVLSASAYSQQPSLEEQAVSFRQGVFQSLSWKMGQLARAKASDNRTLFQQHADDLSYLTGLITEGFIADSLVGDSKAKPSVWEDPKGFQQAADNMQKMAAELADVNYDMGSFNPRNFGRESCGGCHKDFKERN